MRPLVVVTALFLASLAGVAAGDGPVAAPTASVLVHFDAPPSDSDVLDLSDVGLTVLTRYDVVDVLHAVGPAAAIARAAGVPGVTHIERDAVQTYYLDSAADAMRLRTTWAASHQAWSAAGPGALTSGGFDGAGIGIAIVDSGIDATHPDLLHRDLGEATGQPWATLANYKVVGRDSADAFDGGDVSQLVEANTLAVPMVNTDHSSGHGTHVAGAAAGRGVASDGKYRGASPGAYLVGYGAGEGLTVSMALAAYDHIHAHHAELGIRIVSSSWGGPGEYQPNFAISKATHRLLDDGLIVVYAAGNSGGAGGVETSAWANIPGVISVANWDEKIGDVHGSSSRGDPAKPETWPDVAAVGTNLVSAASTGGPIVAVGNAQDLLAFGADAVVPAPLPTTVEAGGVTVGPYASFSGTSMAAPMVSGTIALLLQANPDLTADEVRAILRGTTAPGPAGSEYRMGTGLVDVAAATSAALRMRDGISLNNALLTLDAEGTFNDAAPDAGPLVGRIDGPAAPSQFIPTTYHVTATGGDVFSGYDVTWPATGDTGTAWTHAFGDQGATAVAANIANAGDAVAATLPVTVGPPVGTLLAEGFEDPNLPGWIIDNAGPAGAASGWEWRGADPTPTYFGVLVGQSEGNGFLHGGIRHTAGTGGIAYLPGAHATATLAAPLALAGASAVTFDYTIMGQSVAPFTLEARFDDGDWMEVDRVAGNLIFGRSDLLTTPRSVTLPVPAGAADLDVRLVYDARLPAADAVDVFLWAGLESGTWGGWAVDALRVEAAY